MMIYNGGEMSFLSVGVKLSVLYQSSQSEDSLQVLCKSSLTF